MYMFVSRDTADWWPADLNAKAVVSVAAFMVPNTDHVYSKVKVFYIIVLFCTKGYYLLHTSYILF